MKIALCFSGQPRTFEKSFPYVEENLINCNPQHDFNLIGYLNSDSPFPSSKFDLLVVEEDVELPDLNYQSQNCHTYHARSVFYQLYGLQKVNELRKQHEQSKGFKYDYICRIRPDFQCITEVDLSNLEFDKIYLPVKDDWAGYNDRFAIGSNNVMDVYMSRYAFWMSEHPEIPNYIQHCLHYAEANLKLWLDKCNIEIDRIPFSYRCPTNRRLFLLL